MCVTYYPTILNYKSPIIQSILNPELLGQVSLNSQVFSYRLVRSPCVGSFRDSIVQCTYKVEVAFYDWKIKLI